MKTLSFKIEIKASAQKIWDTITNKEKYEEWVGVAFPGSTFIGEWKQGTQMRFVGPDGGGMLAEFIEIIPTKLIKMVHVAFLLQNGEVDQNSDVAKSIIGTTENYVLTETDGMTELTIEMTMNPEWIEMFENSWPKSLERLKEICEK